MGFKLYNIKTLVCISSILIIFNFKYTTSFIKT